MNDNITDPTQEIRAMEAVADALSVLDAEATSRVLRWAAERFGNIPLPGPSNPGRGIGGAKDGDSAPPPGEGTPEYESLAELHAALSPKTDAERALIAAYWFQCVEEMPEFGAHKINVALRDLGHRISNITTAFNTLIGQKPQLVVQLKKSGGSKQSRKTYKLTAAGRAKVQEMVKAGE